MDIIVTIPKNRVHEIEEEEKRVADLVAGGEEVHFFWSLPTGPKHAASGDRCFFLWREAIRAWHKIIGFDLDVTCDFTDRHYPGPCVILDAEIHEIDPIYMKGFRGFRYVRGSLGV